ncbi:Myosin type-2 heavy chain 1 [Coelomomyces lativittatus]|nr:Myosin type-2 heavy chain 1 [Coelomomyces lativittatus]KAJ1513823.1 Myosin type-2 heavy chain 1 [Coelomomyces lativittatus]KAJ1516586.1 Myosin type-2 heavy chain 1 [Coelomomyces lativittatus]
MKITLDTILSLYSDGTQVWVQDEINGWLGAEVTGINQTSTQIEIMVLTDRAQTMTFSTPLDTPSTDTLPPLKNPPMLEGIEDLTNLSHLHEPAVLHNIKTRYFRHSIYTYSGIVLIAMNPFQKVQLYSQDLVRAYSGKRRGELEPHLFAVAEDAFRGMLRDKKNQSIIVSGESGAGKTVSAKYIMRYFATAETDDFSANEIRQLDANTVSEVEQQVLATNPIMESFGNAKTTRNDNSSRFGKYIELLFDEKACIVGARIRTYLLERSRVAYQPESERNYHIFYQLCAGAPAAEKKELGLQSHSQFFYLNQGGGTGTVAGVDDAAEFEMTQRALSTVGVSVNVQWQLFRVLAAILHLGNIQITETRSKEASVSIEDASLQKTCELLGIDLNAFHQALLKKTLITRGESIVTPLNAVQSITVRDSIAKFIYAGLFEWLMLQINQSLCPVRSYTNFIGVLDIYGFEHFKKNSFEQFCINYANEKLQQEFNQHVFKLEQELYVKEKIPWSFIEFNDNQPCIQLIEGKLGILALLDEDSRMPSGSDKGLIDKLYANFDKKHAFFMKPRFSNTSFVVKHFAYDVEYDVEGFLDKNRDTVPDEVIQMFANSMFDFLPRIVEAQLSPETVNASQANGISNNRKPVKQTLGSVFKQSLVQLMDTIHGTNVSYIRCVKSNSEKKPFHFEPQMVLNQLRACGVLETIRISTQGYPGRWTFEEFAHRYYFLVPSKLWNDFKDINKFCKRILEKTIPDPDKYQIGATKIFFRSGQLAYLEKLRSETLDQRVILFQKNLRRRRAREYYLTLKKSTLIIQAWVRGHLARKKTKELRQRLAATKIQSFFRMFVCRKQYLHTRDSILKIQCAWRCYKARQEYISLKKEASALKIQTWYRSRTMVKKYQRQYQLVVLLQSCTRRWLSKRLLKQLKVEARSISHIKEISYRMESKVVELTQNLDSQEKLVKQQLETIKQLEQQVKSYKDKYDQVNSTLSKTQVKLEEVAPNTREIEQLQLVNRGLTSQLNAANDVLKSKDAEIQVLQDSVAKLKEENAKLKAIPETPASLITPTLSLPPSLLSHRPSTSGTSKSGAANISTTNTILTPLSTSSTTQPPLSSQAAPFTSLNSSMVSSPSTRWRTPSILSPQDKLIHEATQIHALQQQILELQKQLQAEKEKKVMFHHTRSPSVETVPSDIVVRQMSFISPPAAQMTSKPTTSKAVIKSLRRHSSVEIWSQSDKENFVKSMRNDLPTSIVTANLKQGTSSTSILSASSGHSTSSSPRSEEEEIMEQEHLFSLLQDPKLESEVMEGLIRNLVIPRSSVQECSRRQIVFPAHVIGLYCMKLWQHGLSANMSALLSGTIRTIEERVHVAKYEDETVLYWLSNGLELAHIVCASTGGGTHPATLRRTSIFMEGERILNKSRTDFEDMYRQIYFQWFRRVKRRITEFVIPAIIEHQALPGFVSNETSTFLNRLTVRNVVCSIEMLVDHLDTLYKAMRYYYTDEGILRSTFTELFHSFSVHAFNHLILRKNFASWKRGMQIQYNVSRLMEWCSQHYLNEAGIHLERMMQAAKLLQFNRAKPSNFDMYIEDLFDICFLLSPTQISKFMSNSVSEYDAPVSSEMLTLISARSLNQDKEDPLLLETTKDTDTSWYSHPPIKKIGGIEKFLPRDLEMELPRIVLLFKFA